MSAYLSDEKKCENECPNCGAGIDDIDWESSEFGESPFQSATCKKCGCEFREHYKYDVTMYNKNDCKKED